MRPWRALLASRKGRIVLAALAGYLAWQGWLTARAPAKLAPGLPRAGDERVDVRVTLPFPPERFHVLVFQRFGRVSGTEQRQLELRGVRLSDLTRVARPYWVIRVEPMTSDQRR
ncbi:MAG: hypothetical protein ACRELA_16835 [Candidatus Rokuibacteriota bacterium]